MSRSVVRRSMAVAALAVLALTVSGCSAAVVPPEATASAPVVEETPTSEPAPELAALLTAPVPSLCEHDAGVLDGGLLPGIDESDGRVMLDSRLIEDLNAGAAESDYAFVGTDANGETIVAAVVYCDRGGVAWPGQVLVWNASLEPAVAFQPAELTGGDREAVVDIAAIEEGFHVRWFAPAENDAACCYQLSAEAEVSVSISDREVAASGLALHRGESAVREAFAAAKAHEPQPDIQMADGIWDGLNSIVEKGGVYDLDGIQCADTREVLSNGSLFCGVPTALFGESWRYVVYPALDGEWGKYQLAKMDYELWEAGNWESTVPAAD